MADPVKIIEDDHRKVEQLFQQYTSSKDPQTLDEICAELTLHAALEEEHVYPLMARRLPDGDNLRQEAEKEHQEVKALVAEIEGLGFEGDGVEQLATQLQQGVEHHVQEEESEMLPKLREHLDEQARTELAEALTQAKQQAMQELQANLKQAGDARSGTGAGDARGGSSVEGELTKEELYQKAKEQDVEGRSKMDKDELQQAVEQQ